MNLQNEKKMYPVFEVDTSWNDCEISYQLVAAESREDLIKHFKDIWPDFEYVATEDDILDDPNNIEVGDIISEPVFTDSEYESLVYPEDEEFDRIKILPNVFSDKPYTILTTYSYIE